MWAKTLLHQGIVSNGVGIMEVYVLSYWITGENLSGVDELVTQVFFMKEKAEQFIKELPCYYPRIEKKEIIN